MLAWARPLFPKGALRAQLPEGNSGIQMMENPLFLLESLSAMWVSPGSATWVMDMTLALLCGVGLYLLLLPLLPRDQSSPPPGKMKGLRKHQIAKRSHNKIRKKSHAHKGRSGGLPSLDDLAACRDCLKKVEETEDLISLLHSHLRKLRGSDEVLQPGPAEAHQPPGQHEEDPSPNISPPLASLTPMTEHPLPLDSSLSGKPKTPQSDLKGIPVGNVPQRPLRGNSSLASLITAIPGLDHVPWSTSFLSWWWANAKALFFSTWAHGKSQQGCLSHTPPGVSRWGDHSRYQVEAGDLSFINPDFQNILEMLLTKRVELKMWKEKERGGWVFKPVSLEYTLGSLGSMLRSLGLKRDATAQPFCDTKDGAEQLPGSEQLSCPEDVGGHLEHKYSQLFCWGLPSLHSESLVAAAWVSKRDCSKGSSNVVTFNEVVCFCPSKIQAKEPPGPSQKEPLPQAVAPTQAVTEGLPLPVAQIPPTAEVPYHPPPSPPPIRARRAARPTSKQKAQSFTPVKDEHLEWPLQNRKKWKKVLLSQIQKSQEAYSQPSPNVPQDSQASQTTKLSSSPPENPNKPQGQREKDSQKRLLSDEPPPGPPHRLQAPWEPRQPWGQLLGTCPFQAKDQHGSAQPALPSALASECSRRLQKTSDHTEKPYMKGQITFKLEDPEKGLEQGLKREQEDLRWSSRSTSLREGKECPEGSLMRLRKGYSGCHLSTDKEQLEKFLQPHLGKKLGQISEGLIPVCVRRSWLTTSHTPPKLSTHPKSINLESFTSPQPYVNTSKELSFLDPGTLKLLEADITSRARHRWPPPQALESMTSNFGGSSTSSLSEPAPAFSAPRVSKGKSIDRMAHFLEELPQRSPGETVVKKLSVPPLRSPLPASSPAEVQKVWRETTCGGSQGTSRATPTAQEGCLSSQPHTYHVLERSQQRGIIQGTGGRKMEPRAALAMVSQEPQEESGGVASGDCSCSVEIKVGSPPSTAAENGETGVEEERPPEWEVGGSVILNKDTFRFNLSLGSLGNRTSLPLSRISASQGLRDIGLKAQAAGGAELNVQVGSQKQPADPALGILRDTALPPSTARLPSQASLCSQQGVSESSMSASQAAKKEGNSQLQEEPRVTEDNTRERKVSKTFIPSDDMENCEGPKLQELRLVEESPSRTFQLSFPAELRERDSGEKVSSSGPPEKGQAPPESLVKKRVKDFLQCLQPRKKGRGQEDSPQRVPKPPSAAAQSQGSTASRLPMDSGAAEAQVLMTAVGQILVDKLGLQQGNVPSQLNGHKKEPRVPLSRESSYHRGSCDPEQRSWTGEMACGHKASPTGHGHHVGPECTQPWIRDKDGRQDSPLRTPECLHTPCQQRPVGAGVARHLHHYSTYFLQNGVLYGHPDHVSHEFIDERRFLSENCQGQRKPVFSRVSTSFTY